MTNSQQRDSLSKVQQRQDARYHRVLDYFNAKLASAEAEWEQFDQERKMLVRHDENAYSDLFELAQELEGNVLDLRWVLEQIQAID